MTYQRPGRRRHRASALVDTSRVPDPKAAIEALLGQLAYFGGPDTSSDEMPTTAGVRRLLRVSELPPDEQAEVRSAMALFHAFAEHQAGAGQGTPRQHSGGGTSGQRDVYAPVADGGHHSGVASERPVCGISGRRTQRRAKDEIMYWQTFYNSKRLHSTLGYMSPRAFEKKRLAEERKLVA